MSSNSENSTDNRGKIANWIDYRLPIISMLEHSTTGYPTPRNLSYWWNFGSLAGVCLVIQIVSGLFLAMNYTAHVDYSFDSVERIMRDVNYGWLLRYIHAVGASMFFIVVYIHMLRGLYYGSYKKPRELLWGLGVVILLLMMATAFMGYVLPWGQMSFWGAKVITNLFTAIPFIGDEITTLLLGGPSVDNPTLTRFFALHFLLPFVIFGVVFLHLAALHKHGSNNPLGVDVKSPQDTVAFHPYYTIKDFFGFGVFFMVFAWFVFFAPNALGHPDNYIPADPLVTPPHIVPEWYFLPFYAILRSIPDIGFVGHELFGVPLYVSSKLAGVLAMGGAIILLFFLPILDKSPVKSARFRPIYKKLYWILVADLFILGYVGAQSADWGVIFATDNPYIPDVTIGRIATLYYFLHFLVFMPLLSKYEKPLPLPTSIADEVLKKKKSQQDFAEIPA